MKIFQTYTWNKNFLLFNLKSKKLSQQPWFQGILLLTCVCVAMLLANLPWTKDLYQSFLSTRLNVFIASQDGRFEIFFPKNMLIENFVNDILMTVFFFTVGLEIRREIAYGELSTRKKAILPVIAAFGGVLVPALIYMVINHGTEASTGWGIPTATDIAFAVCILTVLGDKVPVSLKVFLTALAIVDDLIAILVVAIFYGGTIYLSYLLPAIGVFGIAYLLRIIGEKRILPYMICAVIVWILFYYSGFHATLAGVVMAFLIPSTPRYNKSQYYNKMRYYRRMLDEEHISEMSEKEFPNDDQKYALEQMRAISRGSLDMSSRVEKFLQPWVNYLILPLFALTNAGIVISGIHFGTVSLGIILGLMIGKPLGITLFSFLSIKAGVCTMPKNSSWLLFLAVACLGGIGFTMSIFVDTLSFTDQTPEIMENLRSTGKLAVLIGSVLSGLLGYILINVVHKAEKS